MPKKTRNLYDNLLEITSSLSDSSTWQSISNSKASIERVIMSNDDEKERLKWVLDNTLIEKVMSAMGAGLRGRGWWYRNVSDNIQNSLIQSLLHRSDYILKKSKSDEIRMKIISQGYYTDVKLIDYVALRSSGELKVFCARICTIKTLRKLKEENNKSLMKVFYERLGPVECLDQMIDDKYADNRSEGYRYAPFGYEKLNEKTSEIARGPSYHLVRKISKEYLPMLLGNRNISKGSWVARALEERMDRGE